VKTRKEKERIILTNNEKFGKALVMAVFSQMLITCAVISA
jgi:hypothetical protein